MSRHICQSKEWAQFKTKMGTPAIKAGTIWLTVHALPKPFNILPWKVGYCPKVGEMLENDWDKLAVEGKKQNCVFIKIESNEIKSDRPKVITQLRNYAITQSSRTFASHTLLLDLTKSEEELLAGMHQKTRYNIKVAERHGVVVEEKNDDEGLNIFLKLQKETAARQKFYVHPDKYYQTLFLTCHANTHILTAKLGNECLGALFLLRYGDTFYYPYGGTADIHRETMFGTLLMWEAIRLGKRLGCKTFDMWGASAGDDPKDPWSGFTRFKKGFGGQLVEFENTYDLVLNKPLYFLLTLGNKVRWALLRLKKS